MAHIQETQCVVLLFSLTWLTEQKEMFEDEGARIDHCHVCICEYVSFNQEVTYCNNV